MNSERKDTHRLLKNTLPILQSHELGKQDIAVNGTTTHASFCRGSANNFMDFWKFDADECIYVHKLYFLTRFHCNSMP